MDGIIFDVDGTLWDSTQSVAEAWTHAIYEHSHLNLTLDAKTMGSVFGKTMTEIGEILFPSLSAGERTQFLQYCLAYEDRYLITHPGTAYPDVRETIEALSQKYDLFIVSNCQLGYIEITMKALQIEPYIKDHLCFGETHTPKSETLRKLMERNLLKCPVYIGDTQGDADACSEVGIPFIFAEYGFGTVYAPSSRIRKFSDLKKQFL